MKVLVLGAGVAGVSSAWYLAEAGHEVTVIDRAEGVAMETSFANAGQLSYGYTTPWAAPGIPTKALKWLFKTPPPLLFRPDGSLYQIEWLWQMLQNCTAARYQINKERMVRISEYSREMFRRFEAQTGMNFEGRKKGTLQIFRQAKEVEAAEQDIAVLETQDKTSLFARMIIASGDSTRQVKALANNVAVSLKEAGFEILSTEGDSGEWTLVDAGDLVVHVMLPAVRDFYDIDTLWGGEKPSFHAGAQKPWAAAD